MLYKQLLVFADGAWVLQDVDLADHSEDGVMDMNGQYLLLKKGLYESHMHGISGYDFSQGTIEAYEGITDALGVCGVAYCAATFVSMDLVSLQSALEQYNHFLNLPVKPGAAKALPVVHLEGPFIAKNCKGAHDERVLQPSISLALFLEIISAAPDVTDWKITLAPELPGALDFIEQTRNLIVNGRSIGVHVFIGHTNAAPYLLDEAAKRGIAGFTHLGNANCERAHRDIAVITLDEVQSNVVRFALEHDYPVELIVDGQHLSKEFILFVYKHLAEKIILVSDALSPANMPDGDYKLGSLEVVKYADRIVLKDNPDKLAGSATCLPDLISKFIAILQNAHVPEAEYLTALYHATITNPRISSISDASELKDDNYVILDRTTGQLMLSCCQGVIRQHRPFMQLIKPEMHFTLFHSPDRREAPGLLQTGASASFQ